MAARYHVGEMMNGAPLDRGCRFGLFPEFNGEALFRRETRDFVGDFIHG